MKKISFWIAKGGTGKTTTAGNVAGQIAAKGGKVLAIDADPQGNLSSWFLKDAPPHELADVLKGTVTAMDAIVQTRESLFLMPTFGIGGGLEQWQETKALTEPFAIDNLLDQVQGFDLVIFDIGPGRGPIGQMVNSSVDEIIPVMLPEFFSADGLEIFDDYLDTMKRTRRARAERGPVVVNRVNQSYSAHQAYKTVGAHIVGQSTDIHDCLLENKTLLEYNKKNKWNDAYSRIAEAVWH